MKISKRDKKILILGGIATALILGVFYVAIPFYESISEGESRLSEKKRSLAQRIRVIASEDQYRAQNEVLEARLNRLRALLLDAGESSMAQNQLENMVRSIAEENGVTISRSTPLQARTVGENYEKITLQINLQGGMLELTQFLHALSTQPKFLEVEEVFVNGFRVRDEIRLQPRMNVSGYIRLGEG